MEKYNMFMDRKNKYSEKEQSINTTLLDLKDIMLSENSQTKIEFLEMKAAFII